MAEPKLALGRLTGLVVIDEIQRLPDIFPVLRALADQPRSGTRFLVLGSASPKLLRQSSETLAGRIAFLELDGLAMDEVRSSTADKLWNGAELARTFGIAATTVRRYLDLFTDALVVQQLQPWYEKVGKRQVKSPKVYLAGTGLLHTLLGLEDREAIEGHPECRPRTP